MRLLKPWRSSSATDNSVRLYGHPPRALGSLPSTLRVHRVTASAALSSSGPTRPTGPNYVPIESLLAGDLSPNGGPPNWQLSTDISPFDGTANWTAICARNKTLTDGKTITWPEGVFACSDFQTFNTGTGFTSYQCGIGIAPWVKGFAGSGKGMLGDTSQGTIFTMKAGSSTAVAKGWVPVQGSSQPTQTNVIKHLNPIYSPSHTNFQVAGTEQGHVYSLVQLFNTPGAATITDLLLTGWDGNAGAPPGETSALAVSGVGAHLVTRLEIDGRRSPGGVVFGAMGLTFQSSVGATFVDCWSHHCRAASFVLYNSYNCELLRCIIDATVPTDKALGNGCMNLEVHSGSKMTSCMLIGRQRKVHISMSGDFGSITRGGLTYSAAGGSLEIAGCNWNDLWGNGQLYVQTWSPYSRGPSTVGGNSYTYPGAAGSDKGVPNDGPSCAPWVHTLAGVRDPNNRWVFDKHYVNPIPHWKLVPA